jgi:oligopeptide transport system ATP-binding protein
MALLEVRDLKTYFRTPRGTVRAVDGVSFDLDGEQTLGMVGESGSGKSVTALSLMQLNPGAPACYTSGSINFDGRNLLETSESEMQHIRGNDVAMIFQDPMTSLNPVLTVGDQIIEAIRLHQKLSYDQARERAIEGLRDVGIPRADKRIDDYPHQYSGGMRQRAMIAMALSCRPKILIADEPTTALDVTIQAQILELMVELQQAHRTAIILITHDLGVLARLADRIVVMYAGRVVEEGTSDDIFYDPLMPYTWSLLRSLPRLDETSKSELLAIPGAPPSLINKPEGCPFHPRCPFVKDECRRVEPALEDKRPGHEAACILSLDEVEEAKTRQERELQGTG